MTSSPNLDLRGLTGAQGKTGRDRPIATGLASARPAANLITPDSFYYATDTGVLSYSNGTAWTDVTAGAQSYTPTWEGTSSNPTLGNGTLVARYAKVGKLVQFEIELTIGSTTTFGAGSWSFTLPVPAASALNQPVGDAYVGDFSAGSRGLLCAVLSGGKVFPVAMSDAFVQTNTTPTYPWTWATSDFIYVSGSYVAS